MIPGFRDKSYEEGLRILRLNTLEERRNRADLIFLIKMYKGLTRPPFDSLFQLTKHDRTRGGHTLKLTKHCSNRDVRLYFFSERVINNWNNLDQSVIEAGSWIRSNGVYMYSEMTRWTYLWIDIRTVLGRIRSLFLVWPYQVNNQVNLSLAWYTVGSLRMQPINYEATTTDRVVVTVTYLCRRPKNI